MNTTIIEVKPQCDGWQVFEAPGVEPYFVGPLAKEHAVSYESQFASLDRAKAHLKRATAIDRKFSTMALEDPDLESLWASLAKD